MARQLEGVSERILNCAKAEFLDKGYTDASLRSIAAAADTSTNSIYVRFGDKEGLFSAIVEPALNEMTERFLKIQEEFHRMDSTAQSAHMAEYADACDRPSLPLNNYAQSAHMAEYADGGTMELVDYMYDHLDEFRLLLDASYGTRFHNFIDELVRIEVEYTYKYMETVGYPTHLGDTLTEKLLHIVTTSRFESIFEVIRHGATDAEVEAAAHAAGCDSFIGGLENGYDTMVGEGGASLSGGEKQRISIARAMLKDAPIIILDEATANVDPENEDRLQKAIEALTRDKTIIMIAHRLKTVRNADQILVLDDDCIVQQGKHSELISQPGIYADFVGGKRETSGWKL